MENPESIGPNASTVGEAGYRTRAGDCEGLRRSLEGMLSTVLAVLGVVVCCGLPIFLIAESGLALFSAITGHDLLLFVGAAVAAVAPVVSVAITMHGRSRNRTRQGKSSAEAC
ncbi:MAG: hypothetical protein QW767_06360 [Thermoprotei archaeon]